MAAYDERSQGDFWIIQTAPDSSGVAGTYVTVGYGTNDTLTRTLEMIEVSDKQTAGVTAAVPGKTSWAHGFEGNYVPGDTGQAAIETAMAMQAASGPVANWWKFVMVDEDGVPVVGAPMWSGQGWIESHEIGAPSGDNATMSFTVRGSGALTKSVVPA